eukprot:TRINITY_DN6646_c0_g1_i1.p2 TRINITY_DN6646_c0_g1~~TRINITY_DN6646_c0_g1_i1.p2  ORF type:complete len:136 (-),score=0.94 TRINITY_DN6646_c0_g1_i1:54-461(-)
MFEISVIYDTFSNKREKHINHGLRTSVVINVYFAEANKCMILNPIHNVLFVFRDHADSQVRQSVLQNTCVVSHRRLLYHLLPIEVKTSPDIMLFFSWLLCCVFKKKDVKSQKNNHLWGTGLGLSISIYNTGFDWL